MDRNETVRISKLAAFGGLTESDASIVWSMGNHIMKLLCL